MSQDHVLDELSAYIDGQADQPARIARHLQFCETCARRHLELLKMSAHLNALPQDVCSPDFTSRVLARIAVEESVQPISRPWFRSFRAPQAAMAAAVAVVAALGILSWFGSRPDAPVPPPVAQSALGNDARLAVELERLMASGADLSGLTDSDEFVEDDGPEIPLEAVLADLANGSQEDEDSGDWYPGDDISGWVDSLDPDESNTFQEVLREYMENGNRPASERG